VSSGAIPFFKRQWPLRTAWERTIVDVFTWSTALALWSPPATIAGKVVAAAVGSAVLLTVGGATLMYVQLHRRPNPAAEQAVARSYRGRSIGHSHIGYECS